MDRTLAAGGEVFGTDSPKKSIHWYLLLTEQLLFPLATPSFYAPGYASKWFLILRGKWITHVYTDEKFVCCYVTCHMILS